MKRFCIMSLCLVILVFAVMISSKSLTSWFGNEESIFIEQDMGCNNLGFIIEKPINKNYLTYIKNKQVVGECLSFQCDEKKLNYVCDKLGLTITRNYNVGVKKIIEGYSPKIKYSIANRRENIQIMFEQNKVVVGSPIIYGSY